MSERESDYLSLGVAGRREVSVEDGKRRQAQVDEEIYSHINDSNIIRLGDQFRLLEKVMEIPKMKCYGLWERRE